MKLFKIQSFYTYSIATIVSLSIMVLVDFVLGAEAEHLNAWFILNQLLDNENVLGDSLAVRHLGLPGATTLMLVINVIFGMILVHVIHLARLTYNHLNTFQK